MAWLIRIALCTLVAVGLSTGCSKDKSDKKQDKAETPKKPAPAIDAAAPKPSTDAAPAKRENTDFDVPAVIE